MTRTPHLTSPSVIASTTTKTLVSELIFKHIGNLQGFVLLVSYPFYVYKIRISIKPNFSIDPIICNSINNNKKSKELNFFSFECVKISPFFNNFLIYIVIPLNIDGQKSHNTIS